MKVRSLKLRDESFGNEWAEVVENRWTWEDFKKNERWRKGWISFDCALYNPDDDRVCPQMPSGPTPGRSNWP